MRLLQAVPHDRPGYLKEKTTRAAWITLLLFSLSLIVFLLGYYTKGIEVLGLSWTDALKTNPFYILKSGSRENLLTIVAVLGVLPATRYLVNLIMLVKAVKYPCPESASRELAGIQEKGTAIYYELYMTGYQESFPMYAMGATANELFGYFAGKEQRVNAAERHIRDMLAKEGRKDVVVKLFTEEKKFCKRCMEAASREEKEKGLQLLESMAHISL